MGCGPSSPTVHVISEPLVSSSTTNDKQVEDIAIPIISNLQTVNSSPQSTVNKNINNKATESNTTAVKPHSSEKKNKNPSIHSTHDVNQNIVIIWADQGIDLSKKLYHDSVTKLQRITSIIYTCTNSKQCVNHVDNIHDKKIFIIVSDSLGEELLPLIHDKPQVEAIYIFSETKRQRLLWANKYSQKVKEILFTMEEIFQKIKADSGLVGSLTPISIIHDKTFAILFQMEINPKVSFVPYAFIDKESTYQYESEMLFSMHTVFRIMDTKQLADRFWQVNLSLTSDNDPQMKLLGDYMRKELGEGDPLSRLGHLMLKMGEFDQAHDIYGTQVDSTDEENANKHFHLNHQLGYVFSAKGDYKTALAYYDKALR
ncbi:hypothetical protein I4U23_015288, partial [Adineta vaga]